MEESFCNSVKNKGTENEDKIDLPNRSLDNVDVDTPNWSNGGGGGGSENSDMNQQDIFNGNKMDTVVVGNSVVKNDTSPVKDSHQKYTGNTQVQKENSNILNDDNEDDSKNETNNTEKEEIVRYITEMSNKLALKERIKSKNENMVYSDDTKLSKQDSSLKKNTAFVRKLRNFTEQQLDTLTKEMLGLNLEKYISEVAAALVEAKLKISDIPAALTLCTKFHEMYSDFSKVLFEHWQKTLSVKKDEKISNPSKMRVDLRFFADSIVHGILLQKDAFFLLKSILTTLMTNDKEEHNNSSIILSFCKHCGEDCAGLIPKKIQELAQNYELDVPRSTLIPADKQKAIKSLIQDYYSSLCTRLIKEHKELLFVEKQNKKILQTKGELSNDRKERWESLNNTFQKLHSTVVNFSEILDETVPELKEDKSSKDILDDMDCLSLSECELGPNVSLWEDDETEKFYEDFPDVKDFVPNIKVGGKDGGGVVDLQMTAPITEENLDEDIKEEMDDGKKDPIIAEIEDIEDDTDTSINPSSKAALEAFLEHLPNCVNKEMIDNAAIEFLMYHNNKSHRRRLVKALFLVPRTRLDLLPYYSRLVAILNPIMPDIASDLNTYLKQDFKYHVRKKDQINIEAKIKVIRFIGELVKFRMYSKLEGLYCLKILLHDFTHHHIEMACNFLEVSGRFFFRSPDTHQRTKIYLEQMMRKKMVLNFDWRYATMIETAFYYVNPPETVAPPQEEKSPLEQFICKLLYEDLNPNDEKEIEILNFMRELDWDDPDIRNYAIKCLMSAWYMKYFNIRCLANLLAGLVEYQEVVGTQVVDSVMEDIRIGLELNCVKMNQRRIAMVKYLGELYNYRMVESNDVFKVLYSLITFGVVLNHEVVSPLDLPESTFRIRLVSVLLETCGQYFNHGLSKTRLDYFIIYFQHYYWFKYTHPIWTVENEFPVAIKYTVRDILLSLRPNIKLITSYEEAEQAVIELHQKLAAKVQPLTSSVSDDQQLATILEGNGAEDDDDESESSDSDDSSYESGRRRKPKKMETDAQYLDQEDDNNKGDKIYEEDISDDGEDDGDENFKFRAGVLAPEDTDFIDAFEKMVSDNLQSRLREPIKSQVVDISVPYNIRNSSKKNYDQLQNLEEQGKSVVNFTLLVRKGNKHQYKNLEVPTDSELAIKLKSQEKAERVEMEHVKKLTLDINDRLEEEDYQDQITTYTPKQQQTNPSREKKQKYIHSKGVPDVDSIFGKKKISYK